MGTASAWSVALVGAQGTMVEIEANISQGLPRTVMVGLPDTALNEAKERCRAAVGASALSWPHQLLTINLTPASLPKAGSHFDIAIATAVLACAGHVPSDLLAHTVLMGELGLDGKVRTVTGLLPALLAARMAGFTSAVVPVEQYREALLVSGMTVWPVMHMADVVEVLHGRPVHYDLPPVASEPAESTIDLSDVRGQPQAVWALEVAAAGGHHVFFHGPPGAGKSMLAQRLPTILPALDDESSLEVSAIHSLTGCSLEGGLVRRPPFSAPHHSATMAALIGGGAKIARPGAISMAHRGVLFLDEAPQFSSAILDALRTPLETGEVTLARSSGQVSYPARFQLMLAANPCPCGMRGASTSACRCAPHHIRRYQHKISGPILDRIDIHQRLLTVPTRLEGLEKAECSATVAERVLEARHRQARRLRDTPWKTNAEVPGHWLRRHHPVKDATLLDRAIESGHLSHRGVDKIIRLAWTLADMDGVDTPERSHVASALSLRDNQWS